MADGGLLGDRAGRGKTVTMLGKIRQDLDECLGAEAGPVVIVVPSSKNDRLRSQWREQMDKFWKAPLPKVLTLPTKKSLEDAYQKKEDEDGYLKTQDVILTTASVLKQDLQRSKEGKSFFLNTEIRYIILDEWDDAKMVDLMTAMLQVAKHGTRSFNSCPLYAVSATCETPRALDILSRLFHLKNGLTGEPTDLLFNEKLNMEKAGTSGARRRYERPRLHGWQSFLEKVGTRCPIMGKKKCRKTAMGRL